MDATVVAPIRFYAYGASDYDSNTLTFSGRQASSQDDDPMSKCSESIHHLEIVRFE